jgi:hypothetical protein
MHKITLDWSVLSSKSAEEMTGVANNIVFPCWAVGG